MELIIMQRQKNDCGVAALATILTYLGIKISYQELRSKIKPDKHGSSFYALQTVASDLGVKSEALQGTADEFYNEVKSKKIALPCIARVVNEQGDSHFVVVKSISISGKIKVADPVGKIYQMSCKEFSSVFLGEIINFEQKTEKRKEKSNTKPLLVYFKDMLSSPKNIFKILSVIVLSSIITVISMIPSLLMKFVTDSMFLADTEESIEMLALLITFGFAGMLIGYFLRRLQGRISVSLTASLLQNQYLKAYNGLTSHDIRFFDGTATGDIQERFSGATEISSTMVSIIFSVLEIIVMIISGTIIYNLSHDILFISIFVFAMHIAISLMYSKALTRTKNAAAIENAKVIDSLRETSEGILTIKSLYAENSMKKRFSGNIDGLKNAITQNAVKSIRKESLLSICSQGIGIIALLWVGANLVATENISMGDLVLIFTLYSYFISPAESFVNIHGQLIKANVEAERLFEITHCTAENNVDTDKSNTIESGSVSLENIVFGYSFNEPVLNDISLSIEDGECVSICGGSGCGKSTVAKIISGLEKPDSGNVLIGGNNISAYSKNEMASKIQYIPQHAYFMTDTIRNNVLLGIENRNITDEEIFEVLHAVKADFVKSLDERLAENGADLSGGQRQKLAIVRAILRKPMILIMDESTSSIDKDGQTDIIEFVKKLNCTKIMITHDSNVAAACDKHIIISENKVTVM